MDVRLLEGIARGAWEETGEELPVDAFVLAERLGLELRGWMKSHGARRGDRIWFPLEARHVRRQGAVRHETAHWLLEDHGLDPLDEESARYLSGALGLPQTPFRRDCERTDYDLFALQRLHPNVSGEAIAARMTQVSPACAWVWDAGRLARVYGPADGDEVAELVDRVLTVEEPVVDGLVRAWPLLDGRHRRVIVVRRAAA